MGWQVLSPFRGYANHQFTGGYDYSLFLCFRKIIHEVNDSEKQVIYLHYWERYRLTEIAEMIKIEYGAVRYFHSTAKKKLRKEYKNYEKITDA